MSLTALELLSLLIEIVVFAEQSSATSAAADGKNVRVINGTKTVFMIGQTSLFGETLHD